MMAGDADALQRLIVHYHAPLHRAVDRRIEPDLRRRLDADDVLQQAYVNAVKALPDPNRDRKRAASQNRDRKRAANPNRDRQRAEASALRFDGPAGFYKWLEAIAVSRLKDQQRALRRQKRDIAREARDPREAAASYPDLVERLAGAEPTPSRRVARDEAVAAVMSCLARLSDDQRAVVRLRFLEGRPVADVAAELGKSEPAIHMLCHRGLKSLRELMVSISRYLTRL